MAIAVATADVPYNEVLDGITFINDGHDLSLNDHDQFKGSYNGLMQSIGENEYNSVKEGCLTAKKEIGLKTALKRIN